MRLESKEHIDSINAEALLSDVPTNSASQLVFGPSRYRGREVSLIPYVFASRILFVSNI